ncbi:MAG: reprolysin-like metallopeptidase [Bacteroidota bacterium]
MRLIFTLLLALFVCSFAEAQQSNYWTEVAEQQMAIPQDEEMADAVNQYQVFELDLQGLRQTLRQAPMEFTAAARNAPLTIELPTPDGDFRTMAVVESPVMHPDLAAKYPQIKSFKVWDVNNSKLHGRIDYSPYGFNALFHTEEGEVFIAPYAESAAYHMVYSYKDINFSDHPPLSCGVEMAEDIIDPMEGALTEPEAASSRTRSGARSGDPMPLRVYDLALTNTAEFAQALGNGTTAGVLARFNTAANLINEVYENELAIRFQLVPDIENIIFLDPAVDPFSDAENVSLIFGDIQDAIVTVGGIPFESFDVGHVLTMNCFVPGGEFAIAGIAQFASICRPNKTQGITCFSFNPGNFQARVRGTLTHELGHQFTAAHTFNNCPGANSALSSGSAYEPGSGSTIMSYSGGCGDQNTIFQDDYFHVKSLEDMIDFSREDEGSTCPTIVPTGNTMPTLNWDYTDGFYIPISTPFELTATATDMEDDPLTYCWEQFNLGPVTSLGNPFGNTPTFQSFPPNPSPSRVFPRFSMLLNNQEDQFEVLPTYDRNLKFRCTVRDNNVEAGAAVWEEVSFEATETAGPFLVEGPNTGNEVWTVGDFVEVTWDVANTDNSLVDCQLVNIRLSTDGGLTYPFTLATSTPNDGSAFVTVPQAVTTAARVRVEAANNVFFDISNFNFDVIEATEPGFALAPTPSFQQVCLPGSAVIDLNTFGVLDFSNAIQLEVTAGLPTGAVANFSANDILPSESSALEIDMTEVTEEGLYTITVQATAEGAETLTRTVFLDVYSNDFSDLSLSAPTNGTDGILLSVPFDWSDAENALTYDFQIATDASFAPNTIIDTGSGLPTSNFDLNVLLEENDIFYWRVRPVNECGPGPWQEAYAIRTTSVDCTPYEPTDVPIPISGSGLPTIESTIFIADAGVISDVNIPLISGSYQPVNSLRITLISPAPNNTEVILFDENCGNTVNFDIGFDDDAPQAIQCPPDDNIVFQPVESLSAFIGESTFGEWTLRIEVVDSGFGGGGGLDDWSIEFCAAINGANPELITNRTLQVPNGEANIITPNELEVQSGGFAPNEIEFNIITPPAHGTLFRANDPLTGGGEDFFQTTINAANLIYQHDGSDTQFDSFVFLVETPDGGWIIPQTFNIEITDDAVVNVEEVPFEDSNVLLYPNPARDELFVAFERILDKEVSFEVFNVQGQLLRRAEQDVTGNQLQIDLSNMPAGVYFLTLRTEDGMLTKRFSVQR